MGNIHPPTHAVDDYGRGDFDRIGEAIEIASAGDRIVVRPDLYQAELVVNKPLEITVHDTAPEIGITIR